MTLDLNDEGALIALMLDHGRCPAKIDRLAAEQVQELLAGSGHVELARRLIAVWRASGGGHATAGAAWRRLPRA